MTDKMIIIAADSKVSELLRFQDTLGYYGKACKVHAKDSLIYGCAGFINESLINSITLIKSRSASLHGKIVEIKFALMYPLLSLITELKWTNPQYFKNHIVNKNFTTFLFGMYENGRPVGGSLSFFGRMNDRNQIYLEDSIGMNYDVPAQIKIGETQVIDSIMKADPGYYNHYPSMTDALNNVFKLQALKTPDAVNDTVDIIGLTPHQFDWIQKNQECD